jgi:hypothetical protein
MPPQTGTSSLFVGLVVSLTLVGCRPLPPPLAQPTPGQDQPFAPRQFDPKAEYLPGVDYPHELAALPDSVLIPLACTPDYFSSSGSDYQFTDRSTGEQHSLVDLRLEEALTAARKLNPDKVVVSITLCEVADRQSLVFFRIGPCGGGCAGIPTIAEVSDGPTLSVLTTIDSEGDGAYFGCLPLALTNGGLLYLSCLGEGTAIIRRVDTFAGTTSIILRCQTSSQTSNCTTE